MMKNIVVLMVFQVFATTFCSAQVDSFAQETAKASSRQQEVIKKADNYTIQRLIIYKGNQILLEKGQNGWMTPALRSNENQSLKEGLDSLAKAIGLTVKIVKLSGVYTYKFKNLPDHKEVSYRTHYTAKYLNGEIIQPKQPDREYKWFAIKDVVNNIRNEALKKETAQILMYPNTLWGGSFLHTFKDGEFESVVMTEDFYPLSDQ
ncbi:NUDIX hydrolase [Sphingobacterium puteale]|nr:hypothetical protein [Sphingobacterium puteale]